MKELQEDRQLEDRYRRLTSQLPEERSPKLRVVLEKGICLYASTQLEPEGSPKEVLSHLYFTLAAIDAVISVVLIG